MGDLRQSIYQWRGSNEKCFDGFLSQFPGCEQVSIKENRRSVLENDEREYVRGIKETKDAEMLLKQAKNLFK